MWQYKLFYSSKLFGYQIFDLEQVQESFNALKLWDGVLVNFEESVWIIHDLFEVTLTQVVNAKSIMILFYGLIVFSILDLEIPGMLYRIYQCYWYK